MSRPALLLLLLLAAASAAHAEEPLVQDRVFVEVMAARATCFVGEATPIRLRVGYDAAWFAGQAVPLFRQQVDVPLHVRASWLDGTDGVAVLDPPMSADGSGRVTVAVNDDLLEAIRVPDVVRGGRTYAVFEVTRRYAPRAAGTWTLAAPSVRFAYATQFEESIFDERVPVDRREVTMRGQARTLRVDALPLMGRPPAFVDAIGRFRATASAEVSSAQVGETFRVTLVLEGEGNLEVLTPPAGARIPGFHVYGVIDDRRSPRRTITYELAPLRADVVAVPAIPFAYFQPTEPAGYRTLQTEPIPLHVRPGAGAEVDAPPEFAPPESRVPGEAAGAPASTPQKTPRLVFFLIGGLLLLFLGALFWALALRRALVAEQHAETDPSTARIHAAREALQESATAPLPERERLLVEYLAAELSTESAAVVSPTLRIRLGEAGVPASLADRTARLLETLVAARYGAPPTDIDALWDDGLGGELDAAFRAGSTG